MKMTHILEWTLNILLMMILGVQYYLLVVGSVILLDTILKLFTLKKKEFSFKTFFNGLYKKILIYPLIVIVIYWLDHFLMNEFMMNMIPIDHIGTKFSIFVLLGKEITSIIDKINIIFKTNIKSDADKIYNKIKYLFKDIKSWFK